MYRCRSAARIGGMAGQDGAARRIGWRRLVMALIAFGLISPAMFLAGSPPAEMVVILLFLLGVAFSAALSIRSEKREPWIGIPGPIEGFGHAVARPSTTLPNF
jgi:hypothetical protein